MGIDKRYPDLEDFSDDIADYNTLTGLIAVGSSNYYPGSTELDGYSPEVTEELGRIASSEASEYPKVISPEE